MALTREKCDAEADAIARVCEEVSYVMTRVRWILLHNSNMAIDWSGGGQDPVGSCPPYIEEVADGVGAGNIVDRTFTRQQVSSAIGSLEEPRKLMDNEAPSQGDHRGTLNLLCRPMQRG